MSAKRKQTLTAPGKKAKRSLRPYPSLAPVPTPAERLAEVEAQAAARGLKPMTEVEFDQYLEGFRDLWPTDEEIDEFLAWLRKSRREGG